VRKAPEITAPLGQPLNRRCCHRLPHTDDPLQGREIRRHIEIENDDGRSRRHMTEKVVIPPADQIEVFPRKHTHKSVEDYLPYGTNGGQVPEMAPRRRRLQLSRHRPDPRRTRLSQHDSAGAGQSGSPPAKTRFAPPPTASPCLKKSSSRAPT